jgi:glycosyltransferase involved in cell wall biosynthesis
VAAITVLTPSYGYGQYIADNIESILQQEDVSLEHIVQDGGSADGTVEILRSFGDRVTWRSEPDLGQSDALNKALSIATGRWVAWLNADEFYLPGGLLRLLNEGDRSGADVVYGDSIEVDHAGRMLGLRPAHSFSPRILRWYGPFLNTASIIVRRSLLGKDPWDPTLKVIMDWELYLSLLRKGAAFRYVAYPVGAYRTHEQQASARPGSGQTKDVRLRHGIPASRWCRRSGLVLHRLHKLSEGSYGRQLRAKLFGGRDLRWVKEDGAAQTFQDLLARCYGSE